MIKRTLWLSIFIFAVAGFTAHIAQASEENEKAILAASDRFYAALNAMFTGDAGPMGEVWSHADDITYMGPAGGLTVGWTEILKIWEMHAAQKLGGVVKAENTHVTAGEDIGFMQCYEIGENTSQDGKLQKVSIRATNIFRKEDGKWKMIGHHTDLLPFLEKHEGA
jgi:ketosteroid isomerase-like protein